MSSEVVLSTKGVSRAFGGLVAVDDISIDVRRGEIYGIIGPNGAGKSTLFNVIAGVVPPSAGTVLLDGARIDRLAPHARSWRGLGRTFQAAQSFGSMSVLESLLTARSAQRRGVTGWLRRARPAHDLAEAERIAERVGLSAALDRRPAALSNLEQQKLAIGLSLAAGCSVLLLDEPSGGLIESEVVELATFVRQIRDGGVTVVLIDHKMRLMMDLCDRILVMVAGRALAEGTPAEVAADEQVRDAYLGRTSQVDVVEEVTR